jgi:hypothetical protein
MVVSAYQLKGTHDLQEVKQDEPATGRMETKRNAKASGINKAMEFIARKPSLPSRLNMALMTIFQVWAELFQQL